MNEEDLKLLNAYADHFRIAHELGWCRNVNKVDRKRLLDVYKELAGKRYKDSLTCGNCQTKFMSEMYGLYIKFTEIRKDETDNRINSEGVQLPDNTQHLRENVWAKSIQLSNKGNKGGTKRIKKG